MGKKTNTLKRTGGCGVCVSERTKNCGWTLHLSHCSSVKITVSTGNAYKIDLGTIEEWNCEVKAEARPGSSKERGAAVAEVRTVDFVQRNSR